MHRLILVIHTLCNITC